MGVQARFYIRDVRLFGYASRSSHGSPQRADGVTYAEPAPAGEVTMSPVTRGEANSVWASATPSGEIKMTIKSEAMQWFLDRNGQEIAITFEDRPPGETED
jgi:hypothetical protein